MALSTAATKNYFVQGEQGKIIKVIKRSQVNHNAEDPITLSLGNKSDTTGSKELSSLQQQRFDKMTKMNNIQSTEDTIYGASIRHCEGGSSVTCEGRQMKLQSIKFEPLRSASTVNVKYEVKNQKNLSNHKLKAHTNTQFVQKKRKPEKAGKGLRHFSMKVCEKVKEKGSTTYNEVADELVAEEIQNQSYDTANCDQKNIRRRVYDALNVLMAMNIISKDKKEIRWIGLPTNSVEQYSAIEKENEKRRERIEAKHQQLRELILQQVSFKNLVERNRDSEKKGLILTPNSSIQLPFIIVNTHKSTKINCSVTNDKSEYIFKFDDKFEMHDDAEVLKRMGLLLGLEKGTCSCADIVRAKNLVPANFEKYIEAYGRGEGNGVDSDEDISYIEQPNYSSYILRTEDDGNLPEADNEAMLDESEID